MSQNNFIYFIMCAILKQKQNMRYLLILFSLIVFHSVDAQTLRILSYNIHHGNPPARKGEIDLESIAKIINEANVDAVGIQEVDINVNRSGLVNQAKKLAELTNMDFFFSKGINLEKGYYGTLILTKHKIVGKRKYDLPNPDSSENRSLAVVDIEMANGFSFSLANTHLDLKEKNRLAQVAFINELGDWYSRPLILVGDLNAKPNSKAIEILETVFQRNKTANVLTFPNINPREEIDYIMLSKNTDFEWGEYKVLNDESARLASDHLPLFAEIKLK